MDSGPEEGIYGPKTSMAKWKSLVPVLYDWLANHHLMWPSLSCRWGPVTERHTYKNKQRIYLSEQTDASVPNTLVISSADIVKPRVAAAEHINRFHEDHKSPFVRKHKTIIHPGEVNRIRELPQDNRIVATHTDSAEVLVWNVETQPGRQAVRGAAPSAPDLVLVGHSDIAEFALAMSPGAPFVLSGGRDHCCVLWSLEDHITSLQVPAGKGGLSNPEDGAGKGEETQSTSPQPQVQPRGVFRGHTDTVEDVQFRPSGGGLEFCSVGDDAALLLWDARVGADPVARAEKAHDGDVHCVDWNPLRDELLLTGSADASVRVFDRRRLGMGGAAGAHHGAALQTFQGHKQSVLCVQWCPDRATAFGSCAEDGLLNVWDLAQGNESQGKAKKGVPPGLLFQHIGHRDKVVDFHWDPVDPWTVVSVSNDVRAGGGTLQIWRISDLIYRPAAEVLAELEKYRTQILGS